MLCAKVEWNSVSKDKSTLVFTAEPDNATTEAVARLPMKILLDSDQRRAKLPHIILGAASGTFVNDGMRIRVDGFRTRQARITHAQCSLVDAEGEVITEFGDIKIEEFANEWTSEKPVEPTEHDTRMFDLAPFKALVKLLRAAGQLKAKETKLPEAELGAVLQGIMALDAPVAPSSLEESAARAEAAAAAEKASPEGKRSWRKPASKAPSKTKRPRCAARRCARSA